MRVRASVWYGGAGSDLGQGSKPNHRKERHERPTTKKKCEPIRDTRRYIMVQSEMRTKDDG